MLPSAARLGALLLLGALVGCASSPTGDPAAAAPGRSSPIEPEAAAGMLELRLCFEQLQPGRGQLVVALYRDAASFDDGGEPYRARFLPVEGADAAWTLSLPAGSYAVKAYQDLDADGELDRGDFGVPSEPYGFSSGARGTFGPPPWSAARFELATDGEQVISLR